MKKSIILVVLAAMLLVGSVLPAPACVSAAHAEGCNDYKIYVTQEARREMKKYKTLKRGDSGSAVRKIKNRLIELGYLYCGGNPDNYFDYDTEDALFEFQLNNNLTGSDGVAYPYTQYKLYDEYAIAAWGRAYFTLDVGDRGWEVVNLQKRLADTGFLPDDAVDGVYGNGTRNAVILFQAANYMAPDGVAHDWQQEILFSSGMISAYQQAK